MFYFKKVYFNQSEKAIIESAFRKNAIRRDSLSSLEASKSDTGSDKRFFGYETQKALYFMRIKSSLEFILPNIIFTLPKDASSFYYAFRLSRLSTVFILLFSIGLISILLGSTGELSKLSIAAMILLFFLFFLGLIWAELRLTQFKIKKAIAAIS